MGFCSSTLYFVTFILICNAIDPSIIWKFCYKNFCACSNSAAVCIEHGDKLRYIPSLPNHIQHLNFTFNHLDFVNQHTFVNVSRLKLKQLVLTSNRITVISADAFDNLSHLQHLDLSGNKIGLASLKGVLQSLGALPINLLTMSNMGLEDHLYDAIVNLNSTSITELHLENNTLTIYNQTSFKHLPNLKKTGMDNNTISRVYFYELPSLKTISLNRNKLSTVPDFCNSGTNHRLTHLFLDQNWITEVNGRTMGCLKHLSTISFNGNPIKHIRQNAFLMLRSLRILILRSLNGPLTVIEDYAFNNSNLFRIDLRDNGLKMHTVSSRMFWGFVNLKELSFSYNQFYYVSDRAMEELFHPLKKLTHLDMGNCGMMTIPKVVTENLTNLKWLSLFKNHIKSWSPDTFNNLRSLTELYLTENLIPSIQENSFPDRLRHRLKHINLANNPFDCTCHLQWFLNWFKTKRRIFKQYDRSYKCASPSSVENTLLINIHLSEQQCLLGVMTIFVIVTLASFVIIITIVISVVYRKRWSLKHYWYMRGYRQRRQREIEKDYTYDIFVIYCEEDLEWITQEMLPFLEDTKGLKLCIQQRDFIPGKSMIDSIVASVKESRGFMLVASNKFVEDEWCQYALTLANKHNEDRGLDRFMVILLEEINHRHVTHVMYAVIKTRDYVVWPKQEADKVNFWEHIYREITN